MNMQLKNKSRAQLLRIVAMALLLVLPATMAAQHRVIVKPDIVYTTQINTYRLGGLNVEPMQGFDEDVLRGYAGVEIGQRITVPGDDVTNILKNYWKQRLFSDVVISADSIVDDQIFLHVKLTARPRISKITYNGVKKTEREDIEQRLGLHEGNQVTPDMLDRARTIIQRYFEEKGYKNVTTDIKQTDDVAAQNAVLVEFNIDKHQKIKVKHIFITGVTGKDKRAIKKRTRRLKSAMKKTHEVNKLYNLFKAKKFIPEKYSEDLEALIKKYNEWGYRDAIVDHDTVTTFDEKHVDIHIDLTEGRKFYINDIEWVGNSVYNTSQLNRVLKMKSGDLYNQTLLSKRLHDDEDAVANQYYNTGYVFSRIVPVETHVKDDSISLEMRVDEGPQATLNKISISGNTRVYDNVIRRELRTKPGDLFSRESIMRSVRDLAQMGHWDPEKMEPDIQPNADNGTVDINYKLVPKSSDQVELSFGWGPTGIVGKLGLKFTNFSLQNLFNKDARRRMLIPQGDGQEFSISAQTNGTYYQQYNVSFLNPWVGNKRPNQLSVNFFYSKQTDVSSNYINSSYYRNYSNYLYGYGTSGGYYDSYNYYDPDKYVKLFGGTIGWGKRLSWPDDFFSFTAALTYERYMLRAWQYFIITDGDCNNINLNLSLSRNSTDNPIYPRTGTDFSASVSLTPPFSLWDGKDYKNLARNQQSATYSDEMQKKYRWVEYHKWKFKLRTYTALMGINKTPVLMTRTEFGILGHYNKYKKSPFETFYMGGDGMSGYSTGYATETIGLRGYENGCLTPYGYDGYAYSRLGLELRYPLMLGGSTNIYALSFVEGGNAWTDVKKFNPFDMKRSAGVGVRIYLPMIGLLGLDWAYGFDKVFGSRSNSGSHFHFVIGQEF